MPCHACASCACEKKRCESKKCALNIGLVVFLFCIDLFDIRPVGKEYLAFDVSIIKRISDVAI